MQVQPAIDTAGLMRSAFEADQANVRTFVASSNPAPAQMSAFVAAQDASKAQFLEIYRTHVAHLFSLSAADPATVNAFLEQITKSIVAIKGEDK
jgi:hypothetical protein